MKRQGLTMTILFEAESLNYGESAGNVTTLKKLIRDGGRSYSYLSRQGLVYEMKKQMGVDTTTLSLDGSVIQFAPEATIDEYPEIDLFGYMKTIKPAKTRAGVVRVSNAISLESFNSDLDFLTNKGLLDRYNQTAKELKDGGNISQSEIHKSFYSYTVTIDLDKVGIDANDDIEISNEEKAKRVKSLLKIIKLLHRDIKGRRENLSPVFAIGGVYDVKNPFFENRIKMEDGYNLNTISLSETMNIDSDVKDNTKSGLVKGILGNDDDIIEKLGAVSMGEFFEYLNTKVDEYYRG